MTNEDLARVGVPLYTLIGRAAGMVTDYSSVWVDYLLLDRPMAFLVPDRDTYTRGLQPPDILDWLPGEMVGEQDPFAAFVADLDSGGALGREERRVVAGLREAPELIEDVLSVNKLYRREFLDRAGLRFPEDVHYEDQLFSLMAYNTASRISIISTACC